MSNSRPPPASGVGAPGKVMISGEYAVLYGAPAIVAAVDRRAQARWIPRRGDASGAVLSPEARATRALAEAELGHVEAELAIDVSALRSGSQKLGVGSSAAIAAVTAGAVYAWHGLDPALHRPALLEHALKGHREVAPEGSGADVAASVLGGFVDFRRDEADHVTADSVAAPDGLTMRVVWTGKEARTSEFVARVKALGGDHPTLAALREQAAQFVAQWRKGSTPEVVAATAAYHRAMLILGEAAGVSIVEERLAEIAALAARHGGAAKPSGAGGGDVALAFFTDRDACEAFERDCIRVGLQMLAIHLGASGVQLFGDGAPARIG